MKETISCNVCEEARISAFDEKDLKSARWVILGVSVNTGAFIAVCPKCDRTPTVTAKKGRMKVDTSGINELEQISNQS